MKIVFFGNSKYSSLVARAVQSKFGLSLVVTKPDKPAGRQKQLTPNPVKEFAQKSNLPVLTCDNLDKASLETIAKVRPDFLVVADYGLILPKDLLTLPKFAAFNVHHSLLPKYRGPSPTPAVILAGEKESGVTIIAMTEKVDAGNILAQEKYLLKVDETSDSLLIRLNNLGAKILILTIKNYLKGEVKPQRQDNSKASYTHRLKKEDGFIDLENPPNPVTFDRMIRAYYPWPGVWSKVTLRRTQSDAEHGRSIKVRSGKSVLIKFLPGNLIQPEGKRPMSISEFRNGYPEVFEQIKHLFSQKAQS